MPANVKINQLMDAKSIKHENWIKCIYFLFYEEINFWLMRIQLE